MPSGRTTTTLPAVRPLCSQAVKKAKQKAAISHCIHGLLEGADRRETTIRAHEEEGTLRTLQFLVQTAEPREADSVKLGLGVGQNAAEVPDFPLRGHQEHAEEKDGTVTMPAGYPAVVFPEENGDHWVVVRFAVAAHLAKAKIQIGQRVQRGCGREQWVALARQQPRRRSSRVRPGVRHDLQ